MTDLVADRPSLSRRGLVPCRFIYWSNDGIELGMFGFEVVTEQSEIYQARTLARWAASRNFTPLGRVQNTRRA